MLRGNAQGTPSKGETFQACSTSTQTRAGASIEPLQVVIGYCRTQVAPRRPVRIGELATQLDAQAVESQSMAERAGHLRVELDVHVEDGEKVPADSDVIREESEACLLYTSPSPRDATLSRMPSSA